MSKANTIKPRDLVIVFKDRYEAILGSNIKR